MGRFKVLQLVISFEICVGSLSSSRRWQHRARVGVVETLSTTVPVVGVGAWGQGLSLDGNLLRVAGSARIGGTFGCYYGG